MMTSESVKSSFFFECGNPTVGTAMSWPNSPSTLLELTALTASLGNAVCKSAANCSANQRETSQPVTTTSTDVFDLLCESTWRCKRFFRHLARFHAVKRLRLMEAFGLFLQSSCKFRKT